MRAIQLVDFQGQPFTVPVGSVVGFLPVVVQQQDPRTGQVGPVEGCEIVVRIGPIPGSLADNLRRLADQHEPARIVIPTGPIPPAPGR